MNKFVYYFFFLFIIGFSAVAQIEDSVASINNIIHKDARIDVLGKKMAEYNEGLALKVQIITQSTFNFYFLDNIFQSQNFHNLAKVEKDSYFDPTSQFMGIF